MLSKDGKLKIKGYYNNTKIANHIRSLANDPGSAGEEYVDRVCTVDISSRSSKEISVAFRLSKALSLMDCAVLDAASAFYAASTKGVRCAEFSAGELAEFMYGSKKARRKDISVTLDKLSQTGIQICISEEYNSKLSMKKNKDEFEESISRMVNLFEKNGDYSKGIHLAGALLPIEKTDGEKKLYRFTDGKVPVLYEYALVVNQQYILFPQIFLRELEPEKGTLNTERVLLERYYLIGRLTALKYFLAKKQRYKFSSFNKIYFSREGGASEILFNLTWKKEEVMNRSKTQLSHRRNEVFTEVKLLLDYFMRIGYITGYKVVEERGLREIIIEAGINDPHTLYG